MESKKPLKHDYRALGSSLASLRVGVGTYSTPPAHLMYSLEKQNAAPSNIHESARCMLRPANLIVLSCRWRRFILTLPETTRNSKS